MGGDISAAQTGIFCWSDLCTDCRACPNAMVQNGLILYYHPWLWAYDYRYRSVLSQFGSYFCRFCGDGDWKNVVVAIVTFLIAFLSITKGKGFAKIVPFLIAIGVYIVCSLAWSGGFHTCARSSMV